MLFLNIVKCLWKSTHFEMTIYRTYEQLIPFYDIVSGEAYN